MATMDQRAALKLVLQEIRDAVDDTEKFDQDSPERDQFLRDHVMGKHQLVGAIPLSESFSDLEITDEVVLAELDKVIEEIR